MRAYVYSVTRATSRLLNAIIGGWSGETLSGRAWREGIHWLAFLLDSVWAVLGDGEGHCRRSYELDVSKGDYPAFGRGDIEL